MKAYHFTSDTLRNGEPIPEIGEWLILPPEIPIIPCSSGLHASEQPWDALSFAPDCLLHLVDLKGELVSHGDPVDKWCGRCRRIIATLDADSLLREFARLQALSVSHLWEPPDIVLEWLYTGRSAAESAAWSAAESAAWSATQSAAWSATQSAIQSAARSAARSAAWSAIQSAARSAAWSAVRNAAWSAAESAAWSATQSATWSAAESAAWSATQSAAWSAARIMFNGMVEEAFAEELSL